MSGVKLGDPVSSQSVHHQACDIAKTETGLLMAKKVSAIGGS